MADEGARTPAAQGENGGERTIIQRYFAPLASGFPGALSLKDDCALLSPDPGHELVITTDPIIEGVHFQDYDPFEIAWKALAVNVSDLVAKGATPMAYLMALALPKPDAAWLENFADGLREAQAAFGLHLIGGDTDRTPGQLTVSITAIGQVQTGRMVRRSGAKPGDLLYVSGTIGDAHLGLRLGANPDLIHTCGLTKPDAEALAGRLRRPIPHVALAPVLRDHAAAAIDVSDGLIGDCAKLVAASGAGGRLDAPRVPLSRPAAVILATGAADLAQLLTGGEDYEVLCAVRPGKVADFERAARAVGVAITRIGEVLQPGAGFKVLADDGRELAYTRAGWDHF